MIAKKRYFVDDYDKSGNISLNFDILHDNNEQEYSVHSTPSERSFGCDKRNKHSYKYIISNQ